MYTCHGKKKESEELPMYLMLNQGLNRFSLSPKGNYQSITSSESLRVGKHFSISNTFSLHLQELQKAFQLSLEVTRS